MWCARQGKLSPSAVLADSGGRSGLIWTHVQGVLPPFLSWLSLSPSVSPGLISSLLWHLFLSVPANRAGTGMEARGASGIRAGWAGEGAGGREDWKSAALRPGPCSFELHLSARAGGHDLLPRAAMWNELISCAAALSVQAVRTLAAQLLCACSCSAAAASAPAPACCVCTVSVRHTSALRDFPIQIPELLSRCVDVTCDACVL
jgi:hypothetical protein